MCELRRCRERRWFWARRCGLGGVSGHRRSLKHAGLNHQVKEEESDAEEDDLNQLQSIETRLLQYDASFTEDDTMVSRANVKNALINAFIRGGSSERYDPNNLEQSYQLHLNVERIRVPETWFQPSMFGIESAGIGEVAGWVLNGFEEEQKKRMIQVGDTLSTSDKLVCRTYRRWFEYP